MDGTGNLIDITANRQAMSAVTDNTMYGNVADLIKTKTGFAVAGAVMGYIWSVSQRTNWMPATFGGLLLGALFGWGVSGLTEKNN